MLHDYNIAKAPLYFVRSGILSNKGGRLTSVGQGSYYWSKLATSYTDVYLAYAHILYLTVSGVTPSGNDQRWYGNSLRCLQGKWKL